MTTALQPDDPEDEDPLTVEDLEHLLSGDDPSLDRPTLLGMLGLAAAERYEEHGERSDLDRVLTNLVRALDAEPDHPDHGRWCYWLGCAHYERAELDGRIDDYDEAMRWIARVHAGFDPADPDRDVAAVQLLDIAWDRSWKVRYGSSSTGAASAAESARLAELLDAIDLTGQHPAAERYLRLMRGLALLERFSYAIDNAGHEPAAARVDLDAGIALAEPAFGAAMAEWADTQEDDGGWAGPARLALAGALLSEAYQRRAELAEDPRPDLDRAVATARTAIETIGPPYSTLLLHSNLAEAHQQRWYVRCDDGEAGSPAAAADLDAAIAAWAVVLDHDWGDWSAGNYGELLRERADATDDADGARAAVAVLRRLVDRLGDDPGAWRYRWDLARAGEVLWRLTGDREALRAADEELGRALAADLGPEDDDRLLRMYMTRFEMQRNLVKDVTGNTSGTSVFRDVVEAGHRAMQRAVRAHPDLRAGFAAMLVFAEFSAVSHDKGAFNWTRSRALLALARTVRDGGPEWQAIVDYGAGALEHMDSTSRSAHPGSDGGLGDLARAAGMFDADDSGQHHLLRMAMFSRASVTGIRRTGAVRGRGPDRQARAANKTGSRHAGVRPGPESGESGEPMVEALLETVERLSTGDLAGVGDIAARVRLAVAELDPASDDAGLGAMLVMLGRLADLTAGPLIEVPAIGTTVGLAGQQQLAGAAMATSVLMTQAAARGDVVATRRAVAHAEAIVEAAPPREGRMREWGRMLAGMGSLEAARRARDPRDDARRAVEHLETVARGIRGVHHPVWAILAMQLAEALRLTGDPDRVRSRELALSALRADSWQVFAQSGTEHSILAAKTAADRARVLAGWCIADRDAEAGVDEELIAALDAGRALVLRAVTGSRMIADRLDAAGRADLAEEWRTTGGEGRDLLTGLPLGVFDPAGSGLDVPDELRVKVLHALGEDQVAGFEPIGSAGVRAGLRDVGADALVYLVPGSQGTAGAAVIVPVTGDPVLEWLPDLHLGDGSPVRRYVRRFAGSRDAAAAHVVDVQDGVDRSSPATTLDELCAWAWKSAMGRILWHARQWQPQAQARLVLVPLGMLGLVPWHAAFTWEQGRRRYAIEDAVVSYSPSAQMLCAAGKTPPVPVRSSLVVGDPGGDLRFAGVEARAVHRQFYAGGTYFGRPSHAAARPGSPQDVLAWIESSPEGPSMLHFACHGAADPARPADAHLVLAGGAVLPAGALLERARRAALDIEQVFLAACTTGVSGDDHDEVLSLATSFLAAGARTVFGSLWPVPDGDTSVLMYMVHHFLRAEGLPPADALHRAQLWMLDPRRAVPDGMPAELRRHLDPGIVFAPVSWAGFTHLGR